MKKLFIAAMAFVASATTVSAQELGYFNHLGVGVEVGTTGIGVELAAPVGNHFAVRAGMNFFPSVKAKDISVDISSATNDWENYRKAIKAAALLDPSVSQFDVDIPREILIDGELKKNDFKLLVDVYPWKKSSFHLTAGFYVGNDNLLKAYTTNAQAALSAITNYNENYAGQTKSFTYMGITQSYTFGEKIGAEVGDYLLTPNGDQVTANLKVSSFKPYVGIGFGRAIPKKRVTCAFDLGVQFWGTPKIYVDQKNGPVQLDKTGVDGDGGVIKTISKVSVYPCLNLRLVGKIF